MSKILIFDAYPSTLQLLAEDLAAEGNTIVSTGNPELVPDIITIFGPDVFILDPYRRGRMDWKLFDSAKQINPRLPVLLLTEWISEDPHYPLADACLPKSCDPDMLIQKIKGVMEKGKPEKPCSKSTLIHDQKTEQTKGHP